MWGSFVANEHGLFANVSMPISRRGVPQGWAFAAVELKKLSEITRDLSTRFGTHAFILDGEDRVIADARLAFDLAIALLNAAADEKLGFDLTEALGRLQELDEDVRLGPSTGSIVQAAVARGIPYRRLTEGSLVQFGWGSKQRRIQAAETDLTSAVAEAIAQDKELTKTLLRVAGGRLVGRRRALFDGRHAAATA